MSLKLKYRTWVSLLTTLVMLWNVAGWLGTGLVVSLSHTHGETSYCDVSFCFCEVEDGETVCSCHHDHKHDSDKHGDLHQHDEHNSGTCYFTDSQIPNTTASQLFTLSELTAYYPVDTLTGNPIFDDTRYSFQNFPLLDGSLNSLLRPPQV